MWMWRVCIRCLSLYFPVMMMMTWRSWLLQRSLLAGTTLFYLLCSVTMHGLDRKRGRKPDDEDPEIKRQRFLERNRAAASRCRAKKKVWVDSLENKCKEIEMYNQNLTQEVAMLRSEVQQLKSILIAHKDCPLIVQQSQTSAGKNTAALSFTADTYPIFRFKW